MKTALVKTALVAILRLCAFAILMALVATQARAQAWHRPSPFEACRAWHTHVGDLIDQHRIAQELDDDSLGTVIRRFYEAQSACSAQRFEDALALYDSIPIGPVRSRSLR